MASDELLRCLSQTKDDRLHYLLSALCIAKRAGSIVENAFYELKNVQEKSDVADLVTETDKLVEKEIFDELKKQFPTFSFIGEESVSDGASAKLTANPTWVVDPIDGTTNFVHMNPNVAVCIGLMINKRSEVGVVLAPMLKETYVAVRGHGAYCNGRRLNIRNPATSLSQALIASEWGASRESHDVETKGRNFIDVILKHGIHGMRSTGSAALNMCLIATNSIDLYFEWGPHIWDYAASYLVVEEAGGVNSCTDGSELDLMARNIISASSRKLIDEIVPTLTQMPVPRDDE